MQKATWARRADLLLIGVIVGVGFSFTTYEVAKTTGDADFCGSCPTTTSAHNPLAGNPASPEAARKDMVQVCSGCHSATFAANYLSAADKQVELYNKYAHAASGMFQTLHSNAPEEKPGDERPLGRPGLPNLLLHVAP